MYDTVKNPIPRSGMWATPNLEALQKMLGCLSGSERALATHFVMLTLNACHQVVEDEILNKEVCAQ